MREISYIDFNLRMATGNEAGANDFYTPRGFTSGGSPEAVEVRAVICSQLREGNIWGNVELSRLKANKNVTKITTIDPMTIVETIIFER